MCWGASFGCPRILDMSVKVNKDGIGKKADMVNMGEMGHKVDFRYIYS